MDSMHYSVCLFNKANVQDMGISLLLIKCNIMPRRLTTILGNGIVEPFKANNKYSELHKRMFSKINVQECRDYPFNN